MFDCRPAHPVRWRVRDEAGKPTVAAFVIRDAQGRVYPSQAKRARAGLRLSPAGVPGRRRADQAAGRRVHRGVLARPRVAHADQALTVRTRGRRTHAGGGVSDRALDRPGEAGWWSGDHHIHAAGCAHYMKPTEGVQPEDMFRHCAGRGPQGRLRPDVGPVLRLSEAVLHRPGRSGVAALATCCTTTSRSRASARTSPGISACCGSRSRSTPAATPIDHWPTLGLNTLRWAKRQGAVCGPAHSGWGLGVPIDRAAQLPRAAVRRHRARTNTSWT